MDRADSNPLDVFIQGWGRMGTQWGVGKVMAEIQALLYLTARPLSLEEMSQRLKTSRSNISLNVRALQDLGVVRKATVPGDRKDYYAAEENVGRVARRLAARKKKRELDPAIRIVNETIRAANSLEPSGDSISTGVDKVRLHELKCLMETIGDVFEAFIETGSTETSSEEAVETPNL